MPLPLCSAGSLSTLGFVGGILFLLSLSILLKCHHSSLHSRPVSCTLEQEMLGALHGISCHYMEREVVKSKDKPHGQKAGIPCCSWNPIENVLKRLLAGGGGFVSVGRVSAKIMGEFRNCRQTRPHALHLDIVFGLQFLNWAA
jgi:hypothetical protein